MTALANAEYLIGSVALGIEEYYLGVGEAPGVWAGRWADELGLGGVVEADQLRALIEGRHPATGDELVRGLRGRTVRAFDMTFSAPNSVSMLWALGSPEAAEAVVRAHVDAVDVALRFLESQSAVALLNDRALLSHALDDTLVARVAALVADPPDHLRSRLGPVPLNETGRATWCHYASRIEADLDRNGTISPPSRYTIDPRTVIRHAATAPNIERNDTLDAWVQTASTIRADALHSWPRQQRVREVDHGVDISR